MRQIIQYNKADIVNILDGIEMGLGVWQWGDRLFWGYNQGYMEKDIFEVFNTGLSAGLSLFDTAETYGQGKSEQLLGKFIKTTERDVLVASKFMPFPWRLNRNSLQKALRASLRRLALDQVALYQIHHPLPPVKIETWMETLVEVMQLGLAKAVGVSNFNLAQTQRSQNALAKEGMHLSSNQVEYNLLERKIEKDGLLSHCNVSGIKLIAYSPLAQGVLSGKYTPQNPPRGFRSNKYGKRFLSEVQPLISLLKKIGSEHGGKTPIQVAINWVICKGAIPIPGAKNYQQITDILGALGWRITEQEMNLLDESSDRINHSK